MRWNWIRTRYTFGALVDRLEPGRELSDQIGITECRDGTVGRCIRPATATKREGEHDRHAGLDVDVSGLVEQRILKAPIRLYAPLEHEPAPVLVFVAHRDLDDRLALREPGDVAEGEDRRCQVLADSSEPIGAGSSTATVSRDQPEGLELP